MNDKAITLDALLEEFVRVEKDKRYAEIQRIQAILNRNPILRQENDHLLFVQMKLHHAEMLVDEMNDLNELLSRRNMKWLNDIERAQIRYSDAYIIMSKRIKERIISLRDEIDDIQEELQNILVE